MFQLFLASPALAVDLEVGDHSAGFVTSSGFDSFAWAGDLDGDGVDDLVGGGGTGAGGVWIWLSPIASANPSADQYLAGGGALGTNVGHMVTAAGDVDGDGYGDLLVSAPYDTSIPAQVNLFRGGPTGVDPVPQAVLTGGSRYFGGEIAGLGDLNGDGYADVGVGDTLLGTVDIFLGSATGLGTTPDLTLVGPLDWGIVGPAGDLDGDGYDDVAVGSVYLGTLRQVDVFYGGPSGPSPTADATIAAPGTDEFGSTFAAGDFDGDGGVELAVYMEDFFDSEAWVYDWTPAGPVLPPRIVPVGFAKELLSAGDVDGDGDEELLVIGSEAELYRGAPGGPELVPALTIDYGGPWRQSGSGDADGNGLDDVVTSSILGDAHLYLSWPDADGDGHAWGGLSPVDCDDADAAVHPGAAEAVADGADGDCDGGEVCYADADGDGSASASATVDSADLDCDDLGEAWVPGADCDDTDPARQPGAAELPGDTVDQDCDGDELCYVDQDHDGARTTATVTGVALSCAAPGEARDTALIDCDDADPGRSPYEGERIGDGIDQDCSGADACYVDADGDGWRTWELVDSTDADCSAPGEAPASAPATDCDDDAAGTNPDAVELPGTGVDEDCDGIEHCFDDRDLDGWAASESRPSADLDCDDPFEATDADPAGDCDDLDPNVNPGVTDVSGDGVDADCDGGEDCAADADLDGYLSAAIVTSDDLDCDDPGEGLPGATAEDCDDADARVAPGAAEGVADGIDQDCDGADLCFADHDGDGAGSAATAPSSDLSCVGAGIAPDDDDCDDTDAAIGPGAEEIAGDGIDQDCDGADLPADPPAPDAPRSGCGCASPGPGTLAWLPLLAGLLARRRP